MASQTEGHSVINSVLCKLTQIFLSIKFEEKLIVVKSPFPKGNVKDLEDVPESVKKDIRYVPCSSIEDVLKEALVK